MIAIETPTEHAEGTRIAVLHSEVHEAVHHVRHMVQNPPTASSRWWWWPIQRPRCQSQGSDDEGSCVVSTLHQIRAPKAHRYLPGRLATAQSAWGRLVRGIPAGAGAVGQLGAR
jgi:hypothetical protein